MRLLLSPLLQVTLRTVAAVAVGLVAAPAHATSFTFTFQNIVDNADTTFNQALGINNSGQIAGYYGSAPNKGYTVVPPYGQANFTNENFPGSVQTQVTGLNNIGTTVGFWGDSLGNNFGFYDISNTFTSVANPNTPATAPMTNQLLGVNNSNVGVGFYNDAGGVSHGYTYNIATHAFSPINDPNGINGTTAAAINNSGTIAGFYIDLHNVSHGFVDQGGTFTTIDGPAAMSTMLLGINNNGLVVGTYLDANSLLHGFLFDINSHTFLQAIDDPSGFGTTTINGINDLDQLVGFYVDANNNTIGLLATPVTAVPLPAALPLFATGLAGLGLLGWRRKKKTAAG